MDPKKSKVKSFKSVVRDTEVKIDRSKKSSQPLVISNFEKYQSKGILKNKNDREQEKFSQPKLNTTRAIAKQMEKLENIDYKAFTKLTQVPQSDLAQINEKVTKKTNFHFNENIYKDLIALNLSDLNVASKPRSRALHQKYISGANKDIEPKLEDFYEDTNEGDKPVMVSAIKPKLSPITAYDSRDLYNRVTSWSS